MNKTASMFFAAGALFALAGMIWGIQMAATQDHSLAPAHGHLNLIGFVVMSVFGAYYALSPAAAASRLATIHFWLTTAAVFVIVPGIVSALARDSEALAQIGSVLVLASMVLFAVTVLRYRIPLRESRENVAEAAE